MDLDFKDTATFYITELDNYGDDHITGSATVPCMYVQNTGYQHGSHQDAVVGTPRLALPADHPFITDRAFRLEGLIVDVNPFGGNMPSQRFKVTDVTPARDLLLENELHHVECALRKIDLGGNVS